MALNTMFGHDPAHYFAPKAEEVALRGADHQSARGYGGRGENGAAGLIVPELSARFEVQAYSRPSADPTKTRRPTTTGELSTRPFVANSHKGQAGFGVQGTDRACLSEPTITSSAVTAAEEISSETFFSAGGARELYIVLRQWRQFPRSGCRDRFSR